ncbi:MAG: hypothetical protein CMM52_06600 [Rhodospirillaceae bacterium]|nr:hypothetical protein [Rhodospirillaceae bacterium]|tara:strand:+ start:248 stop:583 length:336 start_codon:yes stop_codon:yes gene_type:complete
MASPANRPATKTPQRTEGMISKILNMLLGLGPYPRTPNPLLTSGFEPGTLYRHVTERNMTELASVLDVKADEFGIRHVRFLLAYQYQHRVIQAGERTLAMSVFTKRFTPTR